MLVAEAPGATESDPRLYEEEFGTPLVGEAGDALQVLMAEMGFAKYKMFVTNVVKHRPPNNRPPTFQEKQACRPFLEKQIEILQPLIIMCLGKHASEVIRQLAGLEPLGETEPTRGKHYTWFNPKPTRVFNLYHPSYALLRAPHKKPCLISDLELVLEYLEGR